MINTDKEFKTKNDLKIALPILLNPPMNIIDNYPTLNGSGTYGQHIRKVSISNTSDDVSVTRRKSFSIQTSSIDYDNSNINKNNINLKNYGPDNLKNNMKSNQIGPMETVSNINKTQTLSPTIPTTNKGPFNSSSPRKKTNSNFN